MFKNGTVRQDGMVFYAYTRLKGIWLTKKEYHRRIERRRSYQRNCYKLYKSMRKVKRKVGEYCPIKNLYFCRISASGKEIWRDANFVNKLRINQKTYRRSHLQKCKQDPPTNLKYGDQHPDDPNLFVLYKRGNRLYFGDSKQLELRRQRLRNVYKKLNDKYRIIKARKLLVRKYKRGDVNSKTNKVFWYYSKSGNEIWLSPEEFAARHARDKAKQKKCYRKNK